MKRHIRRAVFFGICVTLLLCSVVLVAYLWDFRSIHVSVSRTNRGEVHEQEAIETTRKALVMSDLLGERVPVPFQHDSSEFFARNLYEPGEGYVLWGRAGSDRLWDYLVQCEWKDSSADCFISKAH